MTGRRAAVLASLTLAAGLSIAAAPHAWAFAPRIAATQTALPLVLVRSCGKKCKDARVERRRASRRTTRDARSRFYQRRYRPGYYRGAQTLPPKRTGLGGGIEDLGVEEAVSASSPKFVKAPARSLGDAPQD